MNPIPFLFAGHRTVFLVVPKDPNSPVPAIGFANSRISAETYIEHLNLQDKMTIKEMTLYAEFHDAMNHRLEAERAMARAKLNPREREILGIK